MVPRTLLWTEGDALQFLQSADELFFGEVGTIDLVLHLAVFEKEQSWNAPDAEFCGNGLSVHIDFKFSHLCLTFHFCGDLIDQR